MTDDRDFKRLVRQRMAETGETYTVARSKFTAPTKSARSENLTEHGLPTTVASFKKKLYTRSRIKDLGAHLEQRYGFTCTGITKLDVGVYRVDRKGSQSWIARLFPAVRTMEAVRGDAEVMKYLESAGFPAERTAHPDPVSTLAGQPLLVTQLVAGENRRNDLTEQTMFSLGNMLARLHALPAGPGACAREAGSWHHLSANGGGRRSDVEILLSLLNDAESRVAKEELGHLEELRHELADMDDLEDLPKALTHPDPCGANLIATDEDEGTLIDWTGAGRGPRVSSLANLIWSLTDLSHVDAAVWGYRAESNLEGSELDRLEAALSGFPIILDCWMFLFHGAPLGQLMRRIEVHHQRAEAVAARARCAFSSVPEGLLQKESVNPDQEMLFSSPSSGEN